MRCGHFASLLGLNFLIWVVGFELVVPQTAAAKLSIRPKLSQFPEPFPKPSPEPFPNQQPKDSLEQLSSSAAGFAANFAATETELPPVTVQPTSVSSRLEPYPNDPLASVNQLSVNQSSVNQLSVNQPSVDQLSDVAPTDWAYQALSSLTERYGCIVGYPDRTFRGDRALTRDEFAAGLNACLDAIATRLDDGVDQGISREDLAQLQRLSQEFASELSPLRGRIDALDNQIAELEANQFSTTTQFNILTSFNLSHAFAAGDILAEGIPIPGVSPAARIPLRAFNPRTGTNDPVVGTVDSRPPGTFSHSTYIIFRTSFTGLDELTTLFAVGNGDPPASVFSSAGFTSTFGIPYADSNPVPPLSANTVGMFELKYSFPLLPSVQAVIGPRILPFRHFDTNLYTDVLRGASGLNFYQSTLAGNGLSGSGGLLEWTISPQWLLRAGYLARNDASLRVYGTTDGPADPSRGLFNSTNSILAELTFSPSPDANIRLLYNRTRIDAPQAYPPGVTPFLLLQSLRGAVDDGFGGPLDDLISHNFVFNFDWTVTPQFALFGRYSYSTSDINPINSQREGGSVNVQAFQLGMAFPDLGKLGALGTLSAVVPFDVLSGRQFMLGGYGDGGTQVDLLASYSYPVTEQLSLVPMFFATLNPNNFSSNPTVYSIILRTQFLF